MTDDESAVDDEREIELSSLVAIFPELVRDPEDPHSITIDIPVTSNKPFIIKSKKTLANAAGAASLPTPPASENEASGPKVEQNTLFGQPDQQHHLSHLSPLLLRCRLEDGYPEERPPTFEIKTELSWLPLTTVQSLLDHGKHMWEDLGKGPMLFDFIDYLQNAAGDVFDLVDEKGVLQLDELSPETEVALIEFDRDAKQKEFDRGTFECSICLTPKKGSSCYRLPRCGHVFCVECLQDFYNSCITEGDITSVKCLDPDCGKTSEQRETEDRTLTPSELLAIPINQDQVQRYVDLKRKARLEQDKDVVYCPRRWCQGPARYTKSRGPGAAGEEKRQWKDGDPEEEMPPPSERVAVCEDCSYAFCRVCKAGWHGELARCWPRRPAELNAEEQASADYLRAHSSPCPTCNSPCQKTHGCNHMVCSRCQSHFCYLCSSWLEQSNPYKHFNTPDSSCYLKLWELEQGDGVDVPPRVHEEPRGLFGNGALDDDDEDDEDDDDEDMDDMGPAAPPARAEAARQDRLAAQRADQAARAPPGGVQAGGGGARREQRPQIVVRDPFAGLQRFVRLVNEDAEDEWDSDELDDLEEAYGNWEIPDR
ncbi:MAG: hypothetical protein M1823_002733 [Watsoniomyces obsoletus]|nr:MAG: hypothetical protein M1823_002733 [Watsoniomyces obsoletus]